MYDITMIFVPQYQSSINHGMEGVCKIIILSDKTLSMCDGLDCLQLVSYLLRQEYFFIKMYMQQSCCMFADFASCLSHIDIVLMLNTRHKIPCAPQPCSIAPFKNEIYSQTSLFI